MPRALLLHGRNAELSRAAELLREARAGRGNLLLLYGEPGIGKTALLDRWPPKRLTSVFA